MSTGRRYGGRALVWIPTMVSLVWLAYPLIRVATGEEYRPADHAETEHADGDDHDEHEHSEAERADADAHDGHEHEEGEHAAAEYHGHEEHADEHAQEEDHDEPGHEDHEDDGLRLSTAQRSRFGIVVKTAGPGGLRNEVRLPGEVVFNEDRLVHLVPRASGIVIDVFKTLGDRVEEGDALAVIDSADLASAKLEFVVAVTEIGCCRFELPRAQAIHDNTVKMLKLLESSPSLEQLQESGLGEMGEYGSRLISAYSERVLTGRTYDRERTLNAKKVSSEGDYLEAENAFKKAQAGYVATRGLVAFEVRRNLLETTRERQLAELEAAAARQNLQMLGLSEAEITALAAAPAGQTAEPDASVPAGAAHAATLTVGQVCTDPNCKDCAAKKQADAGSVTAAPPPPGSGPGRYEIKAPFGGVIVEKHIALGERVGEESDIFTIADTCSVWVNLTVHAKNLAVIRKGQEVFLRADHGGAQARGAVAMVTPFVESATRSGTARVVVDNCEGHWTPGTFVTGFLSVSEDNVPVVVPRDALQSIEGRNVIFVEHDGAFEAVPVTGGRSDRKHVEIAAGLKAGTKYVAEGAFRLKATVVTSSLDSHAGHGH